MLNKQEFAVEDANEMMQILQRSRCIARYDHISHELLSELLVAIATGGEVIGGNNLGSDVRSRSYGLIEVKSRILGTDGPYPRVSLKQRNLDKASWIAAIRWHRDFTLYDAIMLPKDSAVRLFQFRKQAGDLAHISWKDWSADPYAKSIKQICMTALNELA
ncbi:hypothetical protein [Allomesorhizobium camelthorni]|uniref:Uncharacterized protein n=1 Tax=Allomesorhizobium camelthorni TaxID=475069 RepID=A0A6G4W765_9HYPH|nr:hypothetical protein [Mesorhizobium camelthorni]NGO50592.1 hypothetical protein [Mesorhizobium camelthorni]